MRHFLLRSLVALAWLGVFNPTQSSAAPQPEPDKLNLTGAWTLDLKASTSLEALMTRMGASLLDRKYAAWTTLTAALHQTEKVLTIDARGPGFALDETLYLDGRNYSSNLQVLGATSVKTATVWSKDYKQIVETHQIKTTEGKEGQLIIKRYLTDDGRSLVAIYSLQLNAEPAEISARQIWHKQA